MRLTIGYQFVPEQSFFNDRQKIEGQSDRQWLVRSCNDEMGAKNRQKVPRLRKSGIDAFGHRVPAIKRRVIRRES